ncbi:MAG: AraC family transcriptional regulator [Helicobacteraceae bacterium]|jgi:YesN/AraC family two-component response regulator|nr:AraC family transcriptional regulator [Helicobacteraceae bacterium]
MVYQAIIKPEYEFLEIRNSSHNFPIHFHKRLCIGKVISGSQYIEINNRENKISKNEVYIIPPYITHSCKTNGNRDYLVFSLNPSEIKNWEILSEGAKYLDLDLTKIKKLIDGIICSNDLEKNNIVNYLLNYCEENQNNNIKLNDVANKLGYNKYYILHLFKEKMGISLHQYIIQLKIKRAKQNKNNNLLDIALENGFFDQSHFIRHFKRYEGITPKEYYRSKTTEYCT